MRGGEICTLKKSFFMNFVQTEMFLLAFIIIPKCLGVSFDFIFCFKSLIMACGIS